MSTYKGWIHACLSKSQVTLKIVDAPLMMGSMSGGPATPAPAQVGSHLRERDVGMGRRGREGGVGRV